MTERRVWRRLLHVLIHVFVTWDGVKRISSLICLLVWTGQQDRFFGMLDLDRLSKKPSVFSGIDLEMLIKRNVSGLNCEPERASPERVCSNFTRTFVDLCRWHILDRPQTARIWSPETPSWRHWVTIPYECGFWRKIRQISTLR